MEIGEEDKLIKLKRMKNLLYILSLLLVLSACSSEQKEESKQEKNNEISEIIKENIDSKDFSYIDNGGFYINNKGEGVKKSDVKDQKIVYWYFDPKCPYCIQLEQLTKNYLGDIMGDNTLIKYMPLSFLGRPKDEDPNNRVVTYSDMITGVVVSMAENDPDLVYGFLQEVMDHQFIEDLSKLESTEEQDNMVKDIYENKLNGNKWSEIQQDIQAARQTVFNLTEYTSQNEELKSKTPDGDIKVPLILVEGEDKIIPLSEDSEQIRAILEEKLK